MGGRCCPNPGPMPGSAGPLRARPTSSHQNSRYRQNQSYNLQRLHRFSPPCIPRDPFSPSFCFLLSCCVTLQFVPLLVHQLRQRLHRRRNLVAKHRCPLLPADPHHPWLTFAAGAAFLGCRVHLRSLLLRRFHRCYPGQLLLVMALVQRARQASGRKHAPQRPARRQPPAVPRRAMPFSPLSGAGCTPPHSRHPRSP